MRILKLSMADITEVILLMRFFWRPGPVLADVSLVLMKGKGNGWRNYRAAYKQRTRNRIRIGTEGIPRLQRTD